MLVFFFPGRCPGLYACWPFGPLVSPYMIEYHWIVCRLRLFGRFWKVLADNNKKSNNNDDPVQIPEQFFVRLLKIIEDFCLHAMGCWAVTPSTYITCVYWMFTKSMSNMSDSVPLDKMVLLFVRANNQGYQSSINLGLHTLAYFSSHEGECLKW